MEYREWKEHWKKVVEKACNDYTSLTSDERIWYNIRCLIDSVDNGGIISYYYNSGADYLEETLEDLKIIGAEDIIKLMERINNLFPDGRPSKNMEERNEAINSWEDGEFENLYKKIDDKFYDIEEKLEMKLDTILARII